MPSNHIETVFPSLTRRKYKVTSPFTVKYNCIAWAVGDLEKWWWPSPDSYWPPNLARENTLGGIVRLFESLGYDVCDNEKLETGYEKVAIYANDAGKPTHAARQLISGRWTSKLGGLEDIEHELTGLEGEVYGSVVHIMRRLLG